MHQLVKFRTVKKTECFLKYGHEADCRMSNTFYIAIFGGIQVILSQIPNFHKLSMLSVVAAIMSFAYSFIGLGLSISKIAGIILILTFL